ncbi:MAG: alginate lyase family protein [Planctomycetes bacterium]|nr:alginate lyase family protein [Planctomycetota bacterium]
MSPEHYVPDREERSEVLVHAEGVAQAAQAPLEERHGKKCVRIDLSNGVVAIELPLPRADFRAIDLFAVEVATESDAHVEPSLHITMGSRTEGLPVNDYLNSGRAEDVCSEPWREVHFPYENFLIYGIPPGVTNVTKANLRLAGTGTVWIGAVSGVKRIRAEGPRLTDAGLLAELNLERPELAKVKSLAAAGRVAEALAAFLEHIKGRTAPKHIYGIRTDAEPNIEAADAICSNRVLGYDVGTPVNWRANPNGYLEWMHAFNRTFHFLVLLRAYQKTGAAKYARKLDEQFAGWIAANPEPIAHNGGGDPAWETLSTACRIYGSWLECFFSLLSDPNFTDATRLKILKSLHGHAEHLYTYKGYANNWLIVESRAMAVIGMLFPEFKRADAWVAEGLGRLESELTRQIFPDGADWEFAPGYHMMAARGFLDVYEIAKLNGRPLPAAFEDRLPKAFDYIAGMARPDGSLPAVNDHTDWRSSNGRDFLALGARLYARPELLASPEGPFAGRSRSFPDGGFQVLASGTGPEARWMLFDAGPFGASHQHEDALNIELFAMGVPFLVDPGISSYLNDAWTAYYRTTRAHSTVLVNGAGQNRVAVARHHHCESARGKQRACFGPVFDFARAEYRDGYMDQPAGIVHTRTLLFIRGAYWIVFDEVTGDGAERIDALFHFAPMRVEIESKTRRVLTRRLRGANLEIVPLEPRQGLKLDLICGDIDTVQGWVSENSADLPAPVAAYSVRGKSPLRFAAALVPFASGVNAGLQAARLPKLPPEIWGIKLNHASGGSDRILIRLVPEARIPRTGTPLDADVLVERLDARGRRVSSAWIRGAEMTVEA